MENWKEEILYYNNSSQEILGYQKLISKIWKFCEIITQWEI